MRAVVVEQWGSRDVLRLRELPVPTPGRGEVLIDVAAAGVNMLDIAPIAARRCAFVPGIEGAGRVSTVGAGVTGVGIGDRVAWLYPFGSYAEQITLPAAAVVQVPGTVTIGTAAATMLHGVVAHHLVTEVAPIKPGDWILVDAAADALPHLVAQLVRYRGGKVIGLVSRPDLVAHASAADEVLVSNDGRWRERVLDLTDGAGVQAAYGGDVDLTFVRRHIPLGAELRRQAAELFRLIEAGAVWPVIGGRYPLESAALALENLRLRRTPGKPLILP